MTDVFSNAAITPTELNYIWEELAAFVGTSGSKQSDQALFSCVFDGLSSATLTSRNAYGILVPTTDIRLRSVVILTADPTLTGETVTCTISSDAQGLLTTHTANVVSATQTRYYDTSQFGSNLNGTITINSGDTLRVRFSAASSATPVTFCRFHLIYEAFWDKK